MNAVLEETNLSHDAPVTIDGNVLALGEALAARREIARLAAPAVIKFAALTDDPQLHTLVQPELLRQGRLVEVMPKWRFPSFDLSAVHLGNRHIPRPVRAFKEFAAQMAPNLFPGLPT